MYKKSIIINLILIFFIACDEDSPYISNDIDSSQYTSDFHATNEGEEKYSLDLRWNKYREGDVEYEILDEDNSVLAAINSINDTTFTIDMDINEIKTVSLSVNQSNNTEIKIFSRPVSPTLDFNIEASITSNILTWEESTDDDIQETIIYRTEIESGSSLPLINVLSETPDQNIWTIIETGDGTLESYTDNSINTSFNYYYIIKIIDSLGSYRYSDMASNISGSVEAEDVLGLNTGYNINFRSSEEVLNQIYSDRTSFFWQDYNEEDFYEYEIWKSDQPNFEIGSDESALLITITNPLISDFQDYNDVGEGKTWYYKIRLYNIYGNYIESDVITCKTSL